MPNRDNTQDANWPTPKFYFAVNFGLLPGTVNFQEISGLDVESQIIEYRSGKTKEFSTIKMPGIQKFGNITLKRGVFVNDNVFFDWYNKIKMNKIERTTVVINLLDEASNPVMSWTLQNAWPTKITVTDTKSDQLEAAVESIELAHEGLTISNK